MKKLSSFLIARRQFLATNNRAALPQYDKTNLPVRSSAAAERQGSAPRRATSAAVICDRTSPLCALGYRGRDAHAFHRSSSSTRRRRSRGLWGFLSRTPIPLPSSSSTQSCSRLQLAPLRLDEAANRAYRTLDTFASLEITEQTLKELNIHDQNEDEEVRPEHLTHSSSLHRCCSITKASNRFVPPCAPERPPSQRPTPPTISCAPSPTLPL